MSEKKSQSNASGGGGHDSAGPRKDKLCYSVPEAAELLGFSRNFGYELARTGQIPVLRFGRRILVPKAAFDKLLGISPKSEARI